jgi:hypothetical protein
LLATVACTSRAPKPAAPPEPVPEPAPSVGSFPTAADAALPPPAASASASASEDAAPLPARPDAGPGRASEIARRFAPSPAAKAVALDLYARFGDAVTTLPEQDMAGGWRGPLHLVPELPVGKYARHLDWIRAGLAEHDAFFAALAKDAPSPVRYRWQGIELRFFRSLQRRPSAFAEGWSVAYDLEGTLNLDSDSVRELLFHEIFHLNDDAHGDWSVHHLKAAYDALLARCGTRVDCLTPYAPTSTRVRGGTYYAFVQDNGESVHEYAAELAVRYYREQRSVASGVAVPRPFKCGPDPDGPAYEALADEFFGGADRTPSCR